MSTNDQVYDKASIAFQRLTLQKGDVVTVTLPNNIVNEQMIKVAEIIEPLAEEYGVTILCIKSGTKIENLSESDMNLKGWFKFNPDRMN